MFSYHPKSLTWQTSFAPKPLIPAATQHNPQAQNSLFERLPAELKNRIYSHVFSVEDVSMILSTSSTSPPPHPLSLLLTCRRIYQEASILAFNTYTFPIGWGMQPTYLGLRGATSHLSPAQICAIKSVSVVSDSSNAGALLSNALLVFPSLSHFTLKSFAAKKKKKKEKKNKLSRDCHHKDIQHTPLVRDINSLLEEPDLSLQAIEKYAPHSLHSVSKMVTQGRAYAWQSGARWTAHWPQLHSEQCYSRIQCDADGLREELFMDGDAVGTVPGVQACACGCGGVLWTTVVLVQEGGRCVDVSVVYREDVSTEDEGEKDQPSVLLVPGAAPSCDVVVKDASIVFDADEEYWEALRRRNGDLVALCRGLWQT